MARVASLPTPKVGIEAKNLKTIAKSLDAILGDMYALMAATQVVHWNVKGTRFQDLHVLTEEHYKALFKSIDLVAERIIQLGERAPVAGTKTFPRAIDVPAEGTSAEDMIELLLSGHEDAARKVREAALAADEADDIVTNDMLVDCLAFHEKSAWMLRALNAPGVK